MAEVTDLRPYAPACRHPGCTAGAGQLSCFTATGFPRPWHAARRADAQAVADGTPPSAPAEKPAGTAAGRRPSDAQQRILGLAMSDGGLYELSGYRFQGDAQRRAAMGAMADPARGWFRHVRETQHGTLYEITDAGRSAYYRYEEWMQGGPSVTTAISVDQLVQAQPGDDMLAVNRDRLRTLDEVAFKLCRRNSTGLDIRTPGGERTGYPSRLGAKIRELWRAGMVILGSDGHTYELTPYGAQRREQAQQQYAALRISSDR